MKVRLSIELGDAKPLAFEHSGPVVRIGRDPECELSLQGELGEKVSRQHARIEMDADRATLVDTGSSNGTLLNGILLDAVATLRVGDRIQMGYTGAVLTVQEVDLTKTVKPATSSLSRPVLIGALGVLACVAVLIALFISTRSKPAALVVETTPTVVAARPVPATLPVATVPVAVVAPKLVAATEVPKPPPPVKPVVEETAKVAPSEEVKEVGAYVALDQWVSVLLQRQGEAYPWRVLRPEARVSTGSTLISLPGYRSLITLDAGPHVTLWGSLPEFSSFPPVLESVVMLHVPPAGIDADLTLDRGRIVIADRKTNTGPVRVRVRFSREIWELELPDEKSEVSMELWTNPREVPKSGSEPAPPTTCVGLFTKGRVLVKTPGQTLDLGDHSRISWVSQEPTNLHRVELPAPPAWWSKPPDRTAPGVEKALRSLLDWSDLLGGSNTDPAKRKLAGATPVVTTIKTQIEEVKDADNQDVGVFFLAALDEIEPLIGCLKDRLNANVRGVTVFALQTWLSRDGRHVADLARILERRGESKDKAESIIRLLHFFSPAALDQRQTYEELASLLDDENLMVRDLAFWHLDRLGAGGRLPVEAKTISYDPTWDPEKRRQAIEQWKKLLARGNVPLPVNR